MCPSLCVDVWLLICYFPIQTKHSGAHSALRVKGLIEGHVWLMLVSQLSWTAQAFTFAPLTLRTGSTINAAQIFTSPGWTLSSPWPSFSSSTAQLCSGAQQSCRVSYKVAAGPRGEHGETAEVEKPTQFCISHQWVLRTSLPQGHTATLWKLFFLSQVARQGCREKGRSLTHARWLHS